MTQVVIGHNAIDTSAIRDCATIAVVKEVTDRLTLEQLILELTQLSEDEMLALCDALVDDPRLRNLLETIDDYLYLETDDPTPINLRPKRVLN
jgi:hypothetical protein